MVNLNKYTSFIEIGAMSVEILNFKFQICCHFQTTVSGVAEVHGALSEEGGLRRLRPLVPMFMT